MTKISTYNYDPHQHIDEPDLGMTELDLDDFPCCAPVPAVTHVTAASRDPHGYIYGTKRLVLIVALLLFSVVGIGILAIWGR